MSGSRSAAFVAPRYPDAGTHETLSADVGTYNTRSSRHRTTDRTSSTPERTLSSPYRTRSASHRTRKPSVKTGSADRKTWSADRKTGSADRGTYRCGSGSRIPRIASNFLTQLLILITLPSASVQGPHERRLLNWLLDKERHNLLERPVYNESDVLVVKFGLTLQQIIDVDEKNQMINTNIWLNVVWNNYNLAWNESEFGGIQSVRIPPHLIWKPDILMYNSADEDIDSTFPTNVVLSSDGSCLWVPPGLFLSTCKIDITWFPFDDQKCDMKFGSWTYDGSDVNLILEGESGDASSFIPNGEWELIGVPAVRNVNQYACCPQEYIDITFTIHIRRRTLYYGFNLIIPCVLISSMALLTFTLPPDAGEKISLGVTILLSLTVFLLLVAETMPPTSDAVPLIGMYFACIMLMCSLSVVFTVLVLNYHHRTPDTHAMPRWVKKGICEGLAWCLRMKRPGQDNPRKKIMKHGKMKDVELRERSSRSLLANVLDLDDDFRGVTTTTASNNYNSIKSMENDGRHTNHHFHNNYVGITERSPTFSTPNIGEQSALREIVKELRFLTEKIKKDEDFEEQCNDWKYASMVIDRLCLWMFTAFTIISTFAILFSAPNMFA